MGCSVQLESRIAPDEPIPSIRSNFSWILAGQSIYALCQWGMLSVLAKLGSPVIVGQFALALAIAAPVFLFTNLQLRAVQATDARSEYSFGDYFTLRILATSIGLAALLFLALVVSYDATTRAAIVMVAIAKSFECMSDVAAGLLQKNERLDRVAVGLMIRGFLSLFLFAILFVRYKSLELALCGMAVSWLGVLVFYDLRWVRKLLGPSERLVLFHKDCLRRLLGLSLPLGLVYALIQLNINIPRYFLQHFRGAADLGIFASLAYPVVALNLVVYALGQSATTRLSRMYAQGDLRSFKSVIRKLVVVGSVCMGAAIPFTLWLGRPILTLLYRPEYAEDVGVLAILVAGAGLSALMTFLTCGVSAARSFRPQVPVNLAATIAVSVGCMMWVPRFGLVGAALALVISAAVAVAGSALILRNVIRAKEGNPT